MLKILGGLFAARQRGVGDQCNGAAIHPACRSCRRLRSFDLGPIKIEQPPAQYAEGCNDHIRVAVA